MAAPVRRGDIRMFRFRAPDKERPVVVLTRDDIIPFLNAVMVAPVTTSIRDVATQVALDESHGLRAPSTAKLESVMTVPRSGLGRWIGRLGQKEMSDICEALQIATGCDPSMASGTSRPS